MKKLLLGLSVGLLSLGCSPKTSTTASKSQPLSVILDTDMDSDVDDVGALAMLHAYEKTGKARILGVIVTSDDKYSAACTDAINTYFGRPDIPIGVSQTDSLKEFSRYTRKIAEEFPHKIKSNETAETSTSVYRRLLAGQPDGSVVIITIGHLTSLSRLIDSAPDHISPLSGQELISRKVKSWSCMGGQFPSGKEANFYRPDPASTVNCLAKWKLPVIFAGWEVGNQVVTGGADFKSRSKHDSPIYKGYLHYNDFKGRASWDQISVLEAVEGADQYFTVVRDGHCAVAADGSNVWQAPVQANQAYLKLKVEPAVVRQRIDALMLGD
ncbi:nucleoside hydrolase [Larkinella bovis]|uniref:Nucleoside hydrolase n=1 Tax=Larkinella bovis TaxID=683041 RepID=A0ABW0I5U5_9BACT